jgi:DNA-binding transcriptional regulator YhcF (GntR family)
MATEKSDTLHGRILDEFSRKIVDGTWPPGFSLPKETELAEHYGVSRMTMNKVLTRLASDGFVIRRKRSGTVVAQPRAESAVLAINNIGEEVAALGRRYKWALLSSERRASNAQDQRILNLQEDEGQDNCLFLQGLHYSVLARAIERDVVAGIGMAPDTGSRIVPQHPLERRGLRRRCRRRRRPCRNAGRSPCRRRRHGADTQVAPDAVLTSAFSSGQSLTASEPSFMASVSRLGEATEPESR